MPRVHNPLPPKLINIIYTFLFVMVITKIIRDSKIIRYKYLRYIYNVPDIFPELCASLDIFRPGQSPSLAVPPKYATDGFSTERRAEN